MIRTITSGSIAVAALWFFGTSVYATNIQIPNGNFDTVLEIGTGSPATGPDANPGYFYTNGIGPNNAALTGGIDFANADVQHGGNVNIPGWVSDNGSAGVQTLAESGFGAYVNGTGFGASGSIVTSSASLGNVAAGQSYRLSIDAGALNGGGTVIPAVPVVLDLLANGNPLPSSSVLPAVTNSWQTLTKVYTAADLAPYVGQSLTIRFGTPDGGASGQQTDFDNTVLSSSVPEPASTALLMPAILLALRRRRA